MLDYYMDRTKNIVAHDDDLCLDHLSDAEIKEFKVELTKAMNTNMRECVRKLAKELANESSGVYKYFRLFLSKDEVDKMMVNERRNLG
ncbi:MAG: hypothetical protein WC713_12885 [Candidatus Methylomirabilota bacterium]